MFAAICCTLYLVANVCPPPYQKARLGSDKALAIVPTAATFCAFVGFGPKRLVKFNLFVPHGVRSGDVALAVTKNSLLENELALMLGAFAMTGCVSLMLSIVSSGRVLVV